MVELRPLPPAEAIEYFRQKGVAIGFDYRDVWQAEHQAAFTVAKVMQLDILQDIRAEIDRALVEGTTLQDFRKRLTPALQEKGWWGRQVQRDPLTGAEGEVQLGSPRRLKTIYDVNLRTAHSEGQWARIQDNKEAFPYLEYDGNNSEHPRLDHSAWDGLTLPVDHPFWQAHFPVKAYGCKCRARPRTASQVERSGRPVGPAPVVPLVPYVNKRTGEVQQIPAGVDPSFHYPPGGRRGSLARHLVEKLEGAPPPLARASVADLINGPAFSSWYTQPAGRFPVALLPKVAAERLGAPSQVLSLSEETLAAQLKGQPRIVMEDYQQLQNLLDAGALIEQRGGVLLYVLEQADGSVLAAEVERNGAAVQLTRLRRMTRAQAMKNKAIRNALQGA
ncbi:phage minor head protein [Pseudomonas sp. 2023EL-01195]|uniref:phage head morphogenesis protein n=1 Tax=Pseudomonas sp. 2023EL-01195 TaxID=3088134 RepID=UPI00296ADA7D|nr:phage minor head protein [Pseudomonas sp. 2023EL-01195]MDW3711899.1 phage minor head protein [Pseudomonas sp. 2023EL-01195]